MATSTLTRQIGDFKFPAIGFGAMGISAGYGTIESDEERFKLLDAVYKNTRFIDTADVYGDSEVLIGKWMKRSNITRSDIFLSTKFGFTADPNRVINGEPEFMKAQFAESLRKLQTDYVDLYYLHRADSKVPIEVTVGAMATLVKEGKVHHIGLSEISSATLRRAHAVHPIAAIQVEYSPFTLDIEDEKIGLLKTARELGVKIVAYSPLGRGLITGQYRSPDEFEETDFRRHIPRYSKENFPNILRLADGLKEIGSKHGATGGQVALAWLLSQGDDIIPIPGTKKIKYLEENVGAANVKLTQEDIQKVRALAVECDKTHGDSLRYPASIAFTLFSDTPELNAK